jgi:methionyl-tRNA formyltransferase
MRIVFMGTPDFAVPSLEALLKSADHVVGVVTQPDRPKGRGQLLTASPIKEIALREGLPLLQPVKMKDPAFLDALRSWQPDLIAVTAFGRILPPAVLSLPPHGCINVHGSLLPKYRGAGPIQWAIINGEAETGITTMLMDEGMDTGPMLLQEAVAVDPEDTAGTLAPKLAEVGGRLLVETIRRLKSGTVTPRPQDHSQATLAPLLKKEDGAIDWSSSATAIANRIRGLTPWPGGYTYAEEERWLLGRATVEAEAAVPAAALPPGTIKEIWKDAILVATGSGILAIRELQPANSRHMTAAQYLAGHPLVPGLKLSQEPPPDPEAA